MDEFLGEKGSYVAVTLPPTNRLGGGLQLIAVTEEFDEAKLKLEEILDQPGSTAKAAIFEVIEILGAKTVVVLDELETFLDPEPEDDTLGAPDADDGDSTGASDDAASDSDADADTDADTTTDDDDASDTDSTTDDDTDDTDDTGG